MPVKRSHHQANPIVRNRNINMALISIFRICSFVFYLLVTPTQLYLYAQSSENTEISTAIAPLFSSDDPLELTIEADFKSIVANKDAEMPAYDSAQLILSEANGGNETFTIKVRARGYSRRLSLCEFPPLLLNFKKNEVKGTVFEGQNTLKLVTYCNNMDRYQEYVCHEYLVYKMFNIITDTSFRVRLTHITYKEMGKDKVRATNYGFLIEDIDDLAKRFGGEETDRLLTVHDLCDHPSLDRFTLFQSYPRNFVRSHSSLCRSPEWFSIQGDYPLSP